MREKLGQHFLKNTAAVKKIIAAVNPQPNETIIEIGPGEGALTLPLAEACEKNNAKLIGIEKDSSLASSLKLLAFRNLEVLEGDALEKLPIIVKSYQLKASSYRIVGNIPYYITGHLLRIISELKNKPTLTILMIQKEVAERITARPPKMNLLAAATQFWAEPKIIATLKPGDFNPPPTVNSAVIQLTSIRRPADQKTQENRYFSLIKAIFKQPRKTVLNNLSTGLKISKPEALERLKKVGLTGAERPQNLDIPTLIALS